jgi:hypothetical protein
MGFAEFDRIRSKNRDWILADLVIEQLRSTNLSDADIVNICRTQIETNPTDARNEIYSTVLKIVGGNSHEMVDS